MEGVGDSTATPAGQGASGLAQVTELPAGGPHDAGSSSSSPAGNAPFFTRVPHFLLIISIRVAKKSFAS